MMSHPYSQAFVIALNALVFLQSINIDSLEQKGEKHSPLLLLLEGVLLLEGLEAVCAFLNQVLLFLLKLLLQLLYLLLLPFGDLHVVLVLEEICNGHRGGVCRWETKAKGDTDIDIDIDIDIEKTQAFVFGRRHI